MGTLPHALISNILLFLPARRIIGMRSLCRQIDEAIRDRNGKIQKGCQCRWKARGFADTLINPVSSFLQDPLNVMSPCWAIFFGAIDEDGAFWGRGCKPCRDGKGSDNDELQPHDFVIREAVAEWLTEVWKRMQQRYDKSDKSEKYREKPEEADERLENSPWTEALPIQMGTYQLVGTFPFLVLCATRHDIDDPFAKARKLFAKLEDVDMTEQDMEFFAGGAKQLGLSMADTGDIRQHTGDTRLDTADTHTVSDLGYSYDNGGAGLYVADLMFKCIDGVVPLKIWDHSPVPRVPTSFDNNRSRDWNDWRQTRHCAERYFPLWILEDIRRISESQRAMRSHAAEHLPTESKIDDGRYASFVESSSQSKIDDGRYASFVESSSQSKIDDGRYASFVESSSFDAEEFSLYLLSVEIGPYLAGILWASERDSD